MTQAFSRVRFIMTQSSHPGNVGSAARAIKTTGFGELVLVAPRFPDMTAQPEAVTLASGALDVLERAAVHDTLEEALAPVTLAFALTARVRDLGPPPCDIREAAGLARRHLDDTEAGVVAIVLGTERAGLTNAQIELCHRICHIPANPQYSSLNVAQALQLAAWELRYALLAGTGQSLLPASSAQQANPGAAPADGAAVQALLAHWEQALVAVGFLDPAHPKKLMPRMKHLLTRSALSRDEVDMLRGVCTAMIAPNRPK
ncbi:RNA methyltransferase [Bordetella parapertussis]|uniref:RNA methyltransferase n=1 Tax=Bordetella parapertussis TaxID=519 RepID=UPI000C9E574B|nr:RNA methyltransferase [Bordetella parapertussis]PNM44365.1 RNA methyltransferase [Bordetella parapertussis]RFT72603.1 RNA methyltransferase [Bordetella parapertussis]UEB06761.1 RNA methyltransferase [Bordetella parapertussis]